MLAKGCDDFLAYVVNDNNGKVPLGDIQVVREFLDVFH